MKNLYITVSLFLIPIFLLGQNIGVGEATPASKLEIKGDSGTDLLNVKDQSDDSKLYIKNKENVAIHTSNPLQKLDVFGTTYLRAKMTQIKELIEMSVKK